MFRFSTSQGPGTPLAPWGAATSAQYTGAVAPLLGQLGQAAGGMATGVSGALSGLGQAGAQAAGTASQGHSSALGNMAAALANERGSMYGANAMAEAARMGALGNIGSAGLGAYGSMGNNAMQAWAQNQQSYNQALAGMQNANQAALGGMGQARYGALASMAGPTAAQSFMGGWGGPSGFSFNATAGGSPVASGQVGGQPGGSWFFGNRGGGDALGALRQDIMAPDMVNAAASANTDAMNRLDGQHVSARYMPSQMLNQGLGGLLALSNNSMGQLNSGMNQFYTNQALGGNQFYDMFPNVLNRLNQGTGGIQSSLAGAQAGINAALGQGQGFLNNIFSSIQPQPDRR